MKQKNQRNERGITLIALVITIIVLLILAAITLNLIIGERGIFKMAEEAGRNYTNAQNAELADLEKLENMDWYTGEETKPLYARLYKDGTLILSSSDYIDSSREISEDYGDISKNEYKIFFDYENGIEIQGDYPGWLECENNEEGRTSLAKNKAKSVIIYDKIQPINMSGWFIRMLELKNLDLSNIDTSRVTDMSNMFAACVELTDLDLSHFNTSKVINMSCMFAESPNLVNIDLSSFDTKNVNNMYAMFAMCVNLTNLDLSSFDTSKVTNMSGMFTTCTNLQTIYVNPNTWITKQANTEGMFANCGANEVTPKE